MRGQGGEGGEVERPAGHRQGVGRQRDMVEAAGASRWTGGEHLGAVLLSHREKRGHLMAVAHL